ATPDRAFLMVSQLVHLASEKIEQERLLDLLNLFLSEKKENPQALMRLEELLKVRRMWQSNVSLQNALEYMILKEK
ncbi:DNA polymerase III subunit delta', partial [Streptococcus pyogenes]